MIVYFDLDMFITTTTAKDFVIGPHIPSLPMQVYSTLWYLANQETFRQIGDRFGISRSTAHKYINKTAIWIVNYLSGEFLKWPEIEERQTIRGQFEMKKGIPNVIGAIDSSHIRIAAPKEFKSDFFNRKQFYSIHLQAVVDDRKKFIDLCVGEPGSMHDSRVLRKSTILSNFTQNLNHFMGEKEFILGDLAYPSSYGWLVPPFKDFGNLTDQHKIFNYIHSSTRIVVEQAFGLLKGRFRKLRCFDNRSLNAVKIFVVAAAILHNMCITFDDLWVGGEYHEDDSHAPDLETTDEEVDRSTRRDVLFRELQSLGKLF